MRWIALFEDNPEKLAVRDKHAAAHFDYLARHADQIILAGGLRERDAGPWCGGLWLLNVSNREEAVRLCENDPYFTAGLRRSYRLLLWGKAPFYGDVVL